MEIAKEYIISDPEDLLECPYEPSHMVRAKRMQYHIMKCRKNHVCTEFKRCPFNALHEVYATELRYHMAVCEDRHRVDGKIAQECFDNGDLKGCIETPCYKPLDICGDSWETGIPFNPQLAAAEQHLPENVEEDSAEEELIVTEAEKEGLSSRQLKQLYLEKKKAREKQQEEMQKKAMLGEKLRVPRQPSQSLYIHHQQQTRQQQDIYDQVLRNQSNRVTAFGRGQGLPVLQQAKVGGGTSASIVGSLADGKMGPLIATTGREGEAENLGLGRSKIAFSPRGKGQASGMGIMGQGFGQEDDHTCFMEVPFDQLASQPNHQVAYITNGNKTSMLNSSIHQQQFDSSEESDSGDPLPWVGGGYGEAAEMPASSSSSNISLVSQLITGSWAEEVEKTIPIVNSEVTSESSGSDLQESDKVLSKAEAIKKVRKIKKHLKQIDELEMKMRRGRTLEPEAKYEEMKLRDDKISHETSQRKIWQL